MIARRDSHKDSIHMARSPTQTHTRLQSSASRAVGTEQNKDNQYGQGRRTPQTAVKETR